MSSTQRALWVYKNNAQGEVLGNASWGEWTDFFKCGSVQHWGGSWMTSHGSSRKILREEMQKGDLVLCWQTDRSLVLGTAVVIKIERNGSGEELFLRRERQFQSPVPILKLRRDDPDLAKVQAFRPGGGTLFRTTEEEARVLLAACEGWQGNFV